MAGLDPAIHVLATGSGRTDNRVDARVKPAHDDFSGSNHAAIIQYRFSAK
jgi:hypothetical protein